MSIKICAILQPHYLPWVGYFEMIDRVDAFIFLDDVKFIKREWKNRNRIRKTQNNKESKWLTIPISYPDQNKMLNNIRLFNKKDWISKHLNSVKSTYSKTAYFGEIFPQLEAILLKNTSNVLSDFNIQLVQQLSSIVGIRADYVKSSDLGVHGRREEKLLNICHAVGAGTYFANDATATYVDPQFFSDNGVAFVKQNYKHPIYRQFSGKCQLKPLYYLSIIDLLFKWRIRTLILLKNLDF